MQFSPYSMASEKMTQSQQQTNNIDFMEVDYKPSICNVSHVDGVMASLETGLSSSYQCSSGLMRYHSAPSSFYSSLEEEENNEIIAQYFSNNSGPSQSNIKTMQQHQSSISPSHLGKNEPAKHHGECTEYMKRNSLQLPSLKRSAGHVGREDLGKHHHLVAILENGPDVSTDGFGSSQMSFMSQAQASQPGGQNMDSNQTNTVSCDPLGRGTNASSSTSKSTLIRHSSSPAGLLCGLVSEVQGAFQSGYLDEKIKNSMGLGSSCEDNIPPSRVQGQMNCLRQNSSPPVLLSQLAMDMGVRKVGDRLNMSIAGSSAENKPRSSSDDGNLGSGNVRQGYISSFQVGSWEDATIPSGNLSGMQNGTNFSARKRAKELDETMMQGLHNTDTHIEGRNRVASALINRPYNLPRSTSAELAIDEFLQDSVPCKVRAKRGCATHPRSIAERVRRTRISERMRKLQDLVPNSDKQTTNIADMLDEAVEYVKSLQKQVQEFAEHRAKCTCAHDPECAFKS